MKLTHNPDPVASCIQEKTKFLFVPQLHSPSSGIAAQQPFITNIRLMKTISTSFLITILILTLTVSSEAQINRANEKKSVAYRASYQRVASGCMGYHSLEIREGSLWGWGANDYGTIGDGTTSGKTSPVQIGTDNNWVRVATGNIHSLGLKSDGTLWAWGDNSIGQLGNGTLIAETSPVQIGTADNWVSISAGIIHSIGLKSDGTLWAWGDNSLGQLGDGTMTEQDYPVQIGTENKWISISAGGLHSFGLKSDGTLWAWGFNDHGELGDGTTNSQAAPVQIGTDNNWITVSAGMYHSIALKSNGSLWAWGYNADGAVGDGTGITQYSPVQIGIDNKWTAITASQLHSIGLKSDGSLWTWGYNADGELGDGTTVSRLSPIKIGAENDWVSIAAGASHSFGSKSDGTVWAWGYNSEGQLGDGTTLLKTDPIQTSVILKDWLILSGGDNHSVGLKLDGKLWSWGDNSFGQLGDGTIIQRKSPVQIGTGNNWISIDAGAWHNLALRSDGTLWAWGQNIKNQLGDGTTVNKIIPVQIGIDHNWVSIAGGETHSLALRSDGTVWAWGENVNGQLGDGTTVNRSAPVQVGFDNNWVAISTGKDHSLGLKSDGTLWGWGRNDLGQLGDGTNINRASPVQIGIGNDWTNMVAGGSHNLAIKSAGTLWGWGSNNFGEIGDGTNVGKTSPVQIGSNSKWIGLAADHSHSLAMRSNGTVFGWGHNIDGELGITVTSNQQSPVLVSGNDWIYVTTGGSHSLALKSDRYKYCSTGKNANGQLGDGTIINASSFVCNTICNLNGSGTATPVSCFGNADGEANITLTGADAGVSGTYSVDMATSQTYNTIPFTITGLTAGSHTIIVTTTGGCISPSIIVNVAAPPPIAASGLTTPVTCFGNANGTATITLTSSGTSSPGTYTVDGGTSQPYTTNPFIITGLTPGNHTIVATVTAGGCVSSDIYVNVGSTAVFTASYIKTSLSSCSGLPDGTITVTPTGGIAPYTYSWTGITGSGNPATTVFTAGNTSSLTGLNYGFYNVIITDAGGCGVITINNIHVEIGYPVSISNSGSISSSCSNTGSIILYANSGLPPYTYNLTSTAGPFQAGNTFTGLAAGTYTAYVKDAGGCVSTKAGIMINAAVPITVSPIAKAASSCTNDGSIEIYRSGGIPPYSYSLNAVNYQAGNTFTALAAGPYTAYVKDSKGCVGQQNITVTAGAPLSVTANKINTSNCIYDGSIRAFPSGGVAPYTFNLNGGPYQPGTVFSGLGAGNYIVRVKDIKGCIGSVAVSISIAPIIVTAYANPASNCFTTNGRIQLFRSGGYGPYTYSLDAANYQQSNVFTNLSAGVYNGFVQDSKGCVGLLQDIIVGPNCIPDFAKNTNSLISNTFKMTRNNAGLKINLFPNPSATEFTLILDSNNDAEMFSIRITDLQGREIYKSKAVVGKQYKFGKELITGVYIVEVMHGRMKELVKLVKE